MKQISLLLLLFIFAGLLYLSENKAISSFGKSIEDVSHYHNGILKNESQKYDDIADYNFEINFSEEQKIISVKEKILWRNKTSYPANEIQLHFYANAYKSDKTLFANGYNISDPETRTFINVKTFRINSADKKLEYFQPEIANPNDSTVAKVILDKTIAPGDSADIYFEYTLKIPRSVKRMGYATGRNFFFVSQWFPKVGVFENGKWICSQYHPFLNYFADFGNYRAKITVPDNYVVASTGVIDRKEKSNGKNIYNIYQNGIHDFVWLATDDILYRRETYKRKDGTPIIINAYVQPEREKYFRRYFDAVKNCLEYFENNIGIYPYQNISLVDVPRTSASGGMEYPTLFTVSAELFSPKHTGQPEYLVTHEFSHQFFQGLIANNEVYEAWLDEGFASYISTKIMYKYYPGMQEQFKFLSYIPIYGLNFLSYNEIPIIYTNADIQIAEGVKSITNYYRNSTIGTIADTSYKLPTRLSYVVNSYNKPELMLHTLERYIGYKKMMNIFRDYYNTCKFKHPKGEDFWAVVQRNCSEDMTWFCDEFYRYPKRFDYSLTALNKVNGNEYEVIAERLGDGFFKNEIYFYTDKDTLKQRWDTNERWKIFRFKTNNKVIAAEIDPHKKNLLDINFANNSYTYEPRIWASLSISIRWFFWVQNALMILGSIG
jgi:hypothetical protein